MFILKIQGLKMGEADLFRLALEWAEYQKDTTLEQSLENILPLIRFPLMTLKEFTAIVVPTKLLPPSTVIEIFTYFGSDSKTRKSLAKTIGFRAQERHQGDPTIIVPLYQKEEDNLNERVESQVFGELKECIQLCHLQLQGEQLIRGIGLRGVSVHCPSAKSSQSSWPQLLIRLKSKDCRGQQFDLHCNENYTILLKMNRFLDQGEVEDIEFDSIIPLKRDTIYSIEIEEIEIDESTVGQSYLDKAYFGAPTSSTVKVNIDNICQATLDVHRNKLQGFEQDDSELPSLRLIYQLGFGEL